jgi:hypothetical protein
MRDKKRIKRICRKLEALWALVPDMRFGQLLINCGIAAYHNYTFNIEDERDPKWVRNEQAVSEEKIDAFRKMIER